MRSSIYIKILYFVIISLEINHFPSVGTLNGILNIWNRMYCDISSDSPSFHQIKYFRNLHVEQNSKLFSLFWNMVLVFCKIIDIDKCISRLFSIPILSCLSTFKITEIDHLLLVIFKWFLMLNDKDIVTDSLWGTQGSNYMRPWRL